MRIRVFLLLLFLPVISYGQKQGQSLIDSLLQVYKREETDTQKVNILNNLSYAYSSINPDSSIILAQQALALSEKINWPKGIANAYTDLGIGYESKTDLNNALKYELKAMHLFEDMGNNKGLGATLSNIALIYHAQSNYTQALGNDLRALKIFESLNDKQSQAIILENIGTLFLDQKQYPQTQKYYAAAIKLNEKLKDSAALARNMGNMGILYDAQGNYEASLASNKAAFEINSHLRNKAAIQRNLENIGIEYLHLKNFRQALKHQLQALEISKELGGKNNIAINLGDIGETYYTIAKHAQDINADNATVQQNITQAIQYLNEAVDICKQTNYLAPEVEFLSYLSQAYALSGNYKAAYEINKAQVHLKDSVFSIQKMTEMTDMESRREIAIKEKDLQIKDKQIQIAHLKIKQKQEEHILFILGLVLLSIVLALAVKALLTYRKSNRRLADERKKDSEIILSHLRDIEIRNRILEEIAHTHSHDIRGHVATILGLSNLLNSDDPSDPSNASIIAGIIESAKKLDSVIKEVVRKENELDK